jgi:hypothetical protein
MVCLKRHGMLVLVAVEVEAIVIQGVMVVVA